MQLNIIRWIMHYANFNKFANSGIIHTMIIFTFMLSLCVPVAQIMSS